MLAETEETDDGFVIRCSEDLFWRCFRRDGSVVDGVGSDSRWAALSMALSKFPPRTPYRFEILTERYYALYDAIKA